MNNKQYFYSKNEYIARKNAVFNKIKTAAHLYEKRLTNREFLIIAEGKAYPVEFHRRDFAHLCGVARRITSEEFEKRAAGITSHEFSQKDFCFNKRYTLENAEEKLSILADLIKAMQTGGRLIIEPITKSERNYVEALYIETNDKRGSLCFCEDDTYGYMFPKSNRPGPVSNFRGYEEIRNIDYILVRPLGSTEKFKSLMKGNKEEFFKYLREYKLTSSEIDIKYFKDVFTETLKEKEPKSSEMEGVKFEVKSPSGHTLKFSAKSVNAATLGDILKGSVDKMLDTSKDIDVFNQGEDRE